MPWPLQNLLGTLAPNYIKNWGARIVMTLYLHARIDGDQLMLDDTRSKNESLFVNKKNCK